MTVVRRSATPDPHQPREYGQTAAYRPPSTMATCGRCGGHFVDGDEGRGAHVVVFGQTPGRSGDTDENGEPDGTTQRR